MFLTHGLKNINNNIRDIKCVYRALCGLPLYTFNLKSATFTLIKLIYRRIILMKIPRTKRYSIYKKLVLIEERQRITEDNKPKVLDFKPDGRSHYVYKVTDNHDPLEKYYYGSHTPAKNKKYNSLEEEFWTYGTSSKKKGLILKYKEERFSVKIIKVFDNSTDKSIYESFLHNYFNVEDNINFWNGRNHNPLFFARTHTQKTKDKIGKISTEFWKKDEYRNKVMSSRQETYDTEEYKIAKSLSAKKVYEDEAYKGEWYKKCKEKVWDNPEWKEKQSIASKISQNRPEVKEKHRKNTKKLWEDPEWRRKNLENRPSKKIPYVIINKSYDIIREYKSRDELAKYEKISLHFIRNIVKDDKFINIDDLSKGKKIKLKDLHNLKIIPKEQYETNKNR